MRKSFRSDNFSISKIKWKKVNHKKKKIILRIVSKNIIKTNVNIFERDGLELNSNNFKIETKSKIFLLKKWNEKLSSSEIQKFLNLNLWLVKKKCLVQIPQKFCNGKYLIKINQSYWSYFNYIDGVHFKGGNNELDSASSYIAKFTKEIIKYPKKNISKKFKYFSKDDYEIILWMEKNQKKLNNIFGRRISTLIKKNLLEIIYLFKTLKKLYKFKLKKQVIHLDLHPHNIIMKDSKVNGVLDIDSCVTGNYLTSLSYSALKLCKQCVVSMGNNSAGRISNRFLRNLERKFKLEKKDLRNFYIFAMSEVLRRLIYMFKISIKHKDYRWNRMIPVQINHIDECAIFFKKPF